MVRIGNLHPPLTPLIWRAHEVAEVTQHLRHAVYRCVSLVGPGGIGKTRLACAISEELHTYFPDGVWLIALRALAPTTAAETAEQLHNRSAAALAAAIGLTLYGVTHPTDQVAKYFAGKVALLILDSFEHLAAGAAWLPTLLTAAPDLRLLVTTRHRLPLQSQLVYPVSGLSVPPTGTETVSTAHLITEYASLQLFVERAESAYFGLLLYPSTLAAISQLYRMVRGSPWAIEVAVSMLDQYKSHGASGCDPG